MCSFLMFGCLRFTLDFIAGAALPKVKTFCGQGWNEYAGPATDERPYTRACEDPQVSPGIL